MNIQKSTDKINSTKPSNKHKNTKNKKILKEFLTHDTHMAGVTHDTHMAGGSVNPSTLLIDKNYMLWSSKS